MAFSCKKRDYQLFREIVMAMEGKQHYEPHGLAEIVRKAYQMNMVGKQRKRPLGTVLERILRDHTPNPLALSGEDMVRS